MKREEDADKEASDEPEPAQPSSPPIIGHHSEEPEDDQEDVADNENDNDNDNDKDEDMADMTPDSPTRTVSRPVSRAHLPGGPTGMQRSRSGSQHVPNAASGMAVNANGGMVRGASLGSFTEEMDDEGGFDLAKGFQKIGSFHRSLQAHSIPRPPTGDSRTSVSTNI
jgi:hypothetical protein